MTTNESDNKVGPMGYAIAVAVGLIILMSLMNTEWDFSGTPNTPQRSQRQKDDTRWGELKDKYDAGEMSNQELEEAVHIAERRIGN